MIMLVPLDGFCLLLLLLCRRKRRRRRRGSARGRRREQQSSQRSASACCSRRACRQRPSNPLPVSHSSHLCYTFRQASFIGN